MFFIKKIFNKYKKMSIAVKASLWFAFCSFFQRGISVITMPIFTRMMSLSEYGQYSIFQSWYNIFIIIFTFNLFSDPFNKGLVEHENDSEEFFSNQMGLILLLVSIFYCIYLLFNNFISNLIGLDFILITLMFIEIVSNAIFSLFLAKKRFEFDYKKIVLLTIFMSISNPIIGIILMNYFDNKVLSRIISGVMIPFIYFLFIFVLNSKKKHLFNNFSWWKKTLIISIPLLPHYLSLVLLNQADKLMIDYFISDVKTAIYSVAHSAGLLMTIVNTSINGSFVPWLYKKLKKKNFDGISDIIPYILFIVVSSNLILIWFAPEAVFLLAAPEYHEAIWCLIPIAISVYFFFVYTLFVDVEIFYDGNKYVAIASIIAALLNCITNYIFIPIFGYIAAAYTTLISYFITMVLHYIFMIITLRKNNVSYNFFSLKYIVFYSVILISFSLVAAFLYGSFFARIFVFIVFCILVYFNRNKILNNVKMR